MKRHISGFFPKTLCGRPERTVILISHEGEIGVARDICKSCAKLHERSDWERAERIRRELQMEQIMANTDVLLNRPCCCSGDC
jgi:hypothetical protein